MNGHVITIHGVGATREGETLEQLAPGLAPGESFDRGRIQLDGHVYVRYRSKTSGLNLLEVNWSDIKRPIGRVWGLLQDVAPVVIAMLYVADRWHDVPTPAGKQKLRLRPGAGLAPRAFRLWMECAALWSLPLAVLARFLFLAGHNLWKLSTVTALGLAVMALAWWIGKRWTKNLARAAVGWTFVYAALAVGFHLIADPLWLVWATAVCYAVCHLVALLLAGLSVAAILCFSEGGDVRQRGVRAACVYLPLVLFSIVATCLWALALLLPLGSLGFTDADAMLDWNQQTTAGYVWAGFHPRGAELAISVAVVGLALLGLLGAGVYGLLRVCRVGWAGALGPRTFSVLLAVGPVFLAGVLGVIAFDAIQGWTNEPRGGSSPSTCLRNGCPGEYRRLRFGRSCARS